MILTMILVAVVIAVLCTAMMYSLVIAAGRTDNEIGKLMGDYDLMNRNN